MAKSSSWNLTSTHRYPETPEIVSIAARAHSKPQLPERWCRLRRRFETVQLTELRFRLSARSPSFSMRSFGEPRSVASNSCGRVESQSRLMVPSVPDCNNSTRFVLAARLCPHGMATIHFKENGPDLWGWGADGRDRGRAHLGTSITKLPLFGTNEKSSFGEHRGCPGSAGSFAFATIGCTVPPLGSCTATIA